MTSTSPEADPEIRAAAASFRRSPSGTLTATIPACVVTALVSIAGTYLAKPEAPVADQAPAPALARIEAKVDRLVEAEADRKLADAIREERLRAIDQRLARVER